MRQQQLGQVAVRALVPVHAVALQVLLRVAEVEVQVQHVEAVSLGLGGAVEVGFDDLDPQGVVPGLPLLREEARGDPLAHGHGCVPHQEARLGQHLAQAPEQAPQVPQVALPGVRAVPGEVPEAGVHDDHVREAVLAGLQLLQDGLQVAGVHAREEVEAHQVVGVAELADLPVLDAVVHGAHLASVHQLVLLEGLLPLGLELVGGEQAVLLQQEHQVLVHSSLDRVAQDDHELVVQQLLHFRGLQVDHDAQGAARDVALHAAGLRIARTEGEVAGRDAPGQALGVGKPRARAWRVGLGKPLP